MARREGLTRRPPARRSPARRPTTVPPRARHPAAASLAAAFLLPLAVFVAAEARAMGEPEKAEEEAVEASKEWVFCVTDFDAAELPPSQRLIGEVSARRFARSIESVGLRRRSAVEVAAYADSSDADAREKAGKALAEKRNARAALLYKGDPTWKYRKELAAAEAAVREAEERLKSAETTRSRVETEAKVRLSEKNKDGALPSPLKNVDIPVFSAENGLDALLSGSISPYYGRLRLRLRLYSRYLRQVIHEDEVVFSGEDREAALAELESRLKAAVGGIAPAALSVRTENADADIVVDGKLLGVGSAGPVELFPAPARIEVSAPLHETAERTVDLASDELTTVSIALKPTAVSALSVEARGAEPAASPAAESSASPSPEPIAPSPEPIAPAGTAEAADVAVRLGALYAGPAPIVLSVPEDRLAYVEVATADGRGASAVVSRGGRLVMDLKVLPGPDDRPVEDARKKFYGAFARFSLALPVAFFLSGMATMYDDAVTWSGDADKAATAENYHTVANVAVTATVCFFLETAFRCVRYLRAARSGATPLVRPAPVAQPADMNEGR